MRVLRRLLLAAAAMTVLTLSGCMMSGPVEDLYNLPQLPEEYQDLRGQIAAILATGAEYAPPQSGANLPPVQMIDLDGDGRDEALAFFKATGGEERPLKICIFRASGGTYVQAASIDGSGSSIHSIRYEDMDGDGIREVLVSWQASAEVQTLVVYALNDLMPEELVSAAYARYEIADLDNDSVKELILLRSDDTEMGTSADFYDWNGKNLSLHSTGRISVPVAAVLAVQTGSLQNGETAVFVTGRETAPDESYRTVTDILTCRQSGIVNIVLSGGTGVSSEIFPYVGLLPVDINSDGATEVPVPKDLPTGSGTDPCWEIHWQSYNVEGKSESQALTYHNQTDRWYLRLPERWENHFTVQQNNTSASEHATIFYTTRNHSVGDELFTVYTLSGSNREALAAKPGRSILMRRGDTIYAISFAKAYDEWPYALSQEELAQRFNNIVTPWSMSEN